MNDWFKTNGWSIVIGLVSLVATFSATSALYGYRITELERKSGETTSKIDALTANNVQTLISIARIETDIAYIKVQVDKIVR